jgi:sorbitol-6-phosphate 2-dehydrogenase
MNKAIIYTKIIPSVRMMVSRERTLILRMDDRNEFKNLSRDDELRKFSFVEPEAEILVIESSDSDQILQDIKIQLSGLFNASLSYPDYIILKGIGVLALADYASQLDAMLGSPAKSYSTVKGRVDGKIVIVTGGAQGFGGGIAEMLYSEGANVVIADLNEDTGRKMAEKLNSSNQGNQAFFAKVNVSDSESVQGMIAATVKHFGGLDVLISNAGILRAGGLDEMTPETFALMTDVNYKGYFLCAKYASVVMKAQFQYKKDHFMDIIQINSKSGLKGSNRNFAYAGGKFGGIGLTQSFAMELMPSHIKVNSICPGNFFEGPLWSDPEKGLFVQYLRAGKVPGAKNIEDVKAFYEAQVPAGRGCRVIDVVRAIFYIIEQEYETGQAIPVTGGQNMLK